MDIVVNTDDLQPNERGAFWRHVLADTFAPVVVRTRADADVAGSVRGHWAGRLLVTDVRGTEQEHHRTPRLIRTADNAFFQVAIVAEGIGRLEQDGRQAVLRPGDCVLYENTRPFQWKFDSDWDVWVFSLPSDTVRLSESERRHISARRLDGSTGLTGVVSRFLLDLARHSEDLTAGPAEIAAAVNISPRYRHKLFEAEHRTVSLYIKELRLDRARRDLLDPRLTGQPIAAIARACGFGDLSGFNRAFKQAYAITPRELRNA